MLYANLMLLVKVEATGGERIWSNEDLCNFYSSPNIIMMMKSRRVVGTSSTH